MVAKGSSPLRAFSYRGEFYFTRHGRFLDELFDGNQLELIADEDLGTDSDAGCDSGYCMT